MSGMAASFWWLWQMVLDWMWTLKLWRDFPLKTAFIIQSDAKSMSISHSKARRLNISTWEMAAHGFPILLLLHLILESISACPYGSHSQISVENQVMESVRFLRIMFFRHILVFIKHPDTLSSTLKNTLKNGADLYHSKDIYFTKKYHIIRHLESWKWSM